MVRTTEATGTKGGNLAFDDVLTNSCMGSVYNQFCSFNQEPGESQVMPIVYSTLIGVIDIRMHRLAQKN